MLKGISNNGFRRLSSIYIKSDNLSILDELQILEDSDFNVFGDFNLKELK